ncbi:vWA domain-containing protein [Deinococcus yavapaiensis]|uniref:Ca-activated chloride channel family protein n=1 Tax=Deinococcus yavapaiensis KR-236 TaxID=694435 RepID=A0A318SHP1_9DEIO|nr:VWA domain-containing protein [Deinococcus yavapaiensis]PYE53486.1 Ca-activated chloride channel family protein [Deinococcus yavapaiensis KR-236]
MTNDATTPRLELLPLRAALPSGRDHDLPLLVRVHPAPAPLTPNTRPPLNLALVIDRSGSMSGEPLEMAKKAAIAALRQCRPTDRVGVVAFDDTVRIVVPSTLVGDVEALESAVQGIDAGGMTALHDGWFEGAREAAAHLQEGALNRVVVLSDGQANVGLTDRAEIAARIRGLTQRGVSTTAIGLGAHYDEDLLLAMANAGDGNFEHVEDASRLPTLFEEELRGLMRTTGRTVSLGVEPNPELGVQVLRVLNDLRRNEFGRLMLPNLTDPHPVDILVTLRVAAAATRDARRIGVTRMRLAWTDARGARHKLRAELALDVVSSGTFEALPEHPEVRRVLTLLEASSAKRDAVRAMDAGDWATARQSFRRSIDIVASAPLRTPDMEAELQQNQTLLDDFESGKDKLSRKRAVSQDYDRSHGKPRR